VVCYALHAPARRPLLNRERTASSGSRQPLTLTFTFSVSLKKTRLWLWLWHFLKLVHAAQAKELLPIGSLTLRDPTHTYTRERTYNK